MRRLLPLPKLKKKLWRLFSEYVRRRDADENGYVRCISCGSFKHYKEVDAGHFHAGSTSLALYFDERNVHSQCVRCNKWLSGNGANYALALQRRYGPHILEDLESIKHTRDKFNRGEYEEMIETYKKKLESLEKAA